MKSLLRDLRFAARIYLASKSVTFIAVLTLAIGIGANAAMFTLVNALLIRPLPYPDSKRLVQSGRHFEQGPTNTMSYARFRFLQQNNHSLEFAAAHDVIGSSVGIVINGTPQLVQSIRVTADFFRTVGENPSMGRGFAADDDLPGSAPVVVISHRAWVDLFGKDPHILGRAVRLSGDHYNIIGVMPADFTFLPDSDVWIPMRKTEDWTDASNAFLVIGRLRRGATREMAGQDIAALLTRLKEEHPGNVPPNELGVLITPYQEHVVGNTKAPLLVLLGAVGCVLLIACANVANLLLARAVGRRKEIAIRVALGCTRGRILAQLLTESTVLAITGGVLGLGLATFGIHAIRVWRPWGLPRAAEISLDPTVLLFTCAVSLLTGFLFGLAPALQMSSLRLNDPLKESGRATVGKGTRRLQGGLVTGEVALSAILLLAAGLLLSSFHKMRTVDLGFRTEGILTLKTSLAGPNYHTVANVALTVQRAIDALRGIAGIHSAAVVSTLPAEPSLAFSFEILGSEEKSTAAQLLDANWKAVTPEFFQALEIPLRAGRFFSEQDNAAAPSVAIVNQAFVNKFMHGTSAIGARILVGRDMGENFADKPREIIGIVGDTRDNGLHQDAPPTIIIPTAQIPDRTIAFLNHLIPLSWVIRCSGDPVAVTRQVRQSMFGVDINLVASNPTPLAEVLSRSIAREQIQTVLVTLFAGMALLLGAVGLYGIISYSVAERQEEIGIRLALGAAGKQVVWLITRYGLTLVMFGLVGGVVISFVLRRVLAAYLFGLQSSSWIVYTLVPGVLFLTGLAATLVPAFRTLKVDPIAVLRR